MKQKVSAFVLGLALFVSPAMVSADVLSDTLDQYRFLLSRAAAALVDYDSGKVSCQAGVSAKTVKVKERFILAWGSFGAIDTIENKNMWTPNGSFEMVIDKPGTYSYAFTFYGIDGTSARCATSVFVN